MRVSFPLVVTVCLLVSSVLSFGRGVGLLSSPDTPNLRVVAADGKLIAFVGDLASSKRIELPLRLEKTVMSVGVPPIIWFPFSDTWVVVDPLGRGLAVRSSKPVLAGPLRTGGKISGEGVVVAWKVKREHYFDVIFGIGDTGFQAHKYLGVLSNLGFEGIEEAYRRAWEAYFSDLPKPRFAGATDRDVEEFLEAVYELRLLTDPTCGQFWETLDGKRPNATEEFVAILALQLIGEKEIASKGASNFARRHDNVALHSILLWLTGNCGDFDAIRRKVSLKSYKGPTWAKRCAMLSINACLGTSRDGVTFANLTLWDYLFGVIDEKTARKLTKGGLVSVTPYGLWYGKTDVDNFLRGVLEGPKNAFFMSLLEKRRENPCLHLDAMVIISYLFWGEGKQALRIVGNR